MHKDKKKIGMNIVPKDYFGLVERFSVFAMTGDRKSTRLNYSHRSQSRMPSSA